jgi:protein-S-isoprenylcysteine O-methyltransferase Ste14
VLLLRALLSFLALPGAVAFVVPWLIDGPAALRGDGWPVIGAVVLVAGFTVLLWCVRDFFVAGRGTLAPWDPPRRLVVVGLYRLTRNPMYVGVLILVAGWALRAGSVPLAVYDVLLVVGFHARVVLAEEPWLARTFPTEWRAYAAAVPRWGLARSPWRDGAREPRP